VERSTRAADGCGTNTNAKRIPISTVIKQKLEAKRWGLREKPELELKRSMDTHRCHLAACSRFGGLVNENMPRTRNPPVVAGQARE
jgi:hypothetical protein